METEAHRASNHPPRSVGGGAQRELGAAVAANFRGRHWQGGGGKLGAGPAHQRGKGGRR